MDIHIIIPGVFEGNLNHWQDTFFSFPLDRDLSLGDRLQCIVGFCESKKWEVGIQFSLKRE